MKAKVIPNKKDYIIENLDRLYPNPKPSLFYDHDPYTFLISVLLSAQATDKKVNEITPLLFEKASTPFEMVALSVDEIRSIIKPVGLSKSKSQGIHRLSQILIEKKGGEVPADWKFLESLPSVGHKTASVVMSQVFGISAFPVDTHIHRLAFRWKISSGKSVTQTERDCKSFFPKSLWNRLHLQIIFYAREYSPAKKWCLEDDFITRYILKHEI